MQNINEKLEKFDEWVINKSINIEIPFARISIFVVYFWFGILKLLGTSPANPLVSSLLERTLLFITFDQFIIMLGLFEMLIGILFLIPRLERLAMFTLVIHLITVLMPLIILPEIAWQSFMVPTLEGQYIIKNILIVSVAITILAHLKKLKPSKI